MRLLLLILCSPAWILASKIEHMGIIGLWIIHRDVPNFIREIMFFIITLLVYVLSILNFILLSFCFFSKLKLDPYNWAGRMLKPSIFLKLQQNALLYYKTCSRVLFWRLLVITSVNTFAHCTKFLQYKKGYKKKQW